MCSTRWLREALGVDGRGRISFRCLTNVSTAVVFGSASVQPGYVRLPCQKLSMAGRETRSGERSFARRVSSRLGAQRAGVGLGDLIAGWEGIVVDL